MMCSKYVDLQKRNKNKLENKKLKTKIYQKLTKKYKEEGKEFEDVNNSSENTSKKKK